MLSYILSEQGRSSWAEPRALAAAIIMSSVAASGFLPVPLGADAWGMIANELGDMKNDIDEVKGISLSFRRCETARLDRLPEIG
jgi:hypothetical protein